MCNTSSPIARIGATIAAVGIGILPAVAVASPTSDLHASATAGVAFARATTPGVTLIRTRDPETHRPGILVTYRWEQRFDRRYDARIRLLQDGRLVGQLKFLRGWSHAPGFFRTQPTARLHGFRAVGVLLRRDGTVVTGSRERSARKDWRLRVEPGQIVPATSR